jgi:hypothetical protein
MTGKEKTYIRRRKRTERKTSYERQSQTKENTVYTITKDNTSYELHLEKVQGITMIYLLMHENARDEIQGNALCDTTMGL